MPTLVRDLTVRSDTANLQQVREFVGDAVRESRLPERDAALVVLAADEALTSFIRHAHRSRRNSVSRVTVDVDDVRVRICIDEAGHDVEIEQCSDEDLKRHIELARKDELAIFLIQLIMDEINYGFRKGFQNRLELTKFIYTADAAP